MSRFAVIDFETTGLSPKLGDQVIEVGIVIISEGKIHSTYQSLIKPHQDIPRFITDITGITNKMVANAPNENQVINEVLKFTEGCYFVAHNASFDSRFLEAAFRKHLGKSAPTFLCTLLLSRRIYPNYSNYKLVTLAEHLNIENKGDYHRALADAEVAGELFLKIIFDANLHKHNPDTVYECLSDVQTKPKNRTAKIIEKYTGTAIEMDRTDFAPLKSPDVIKPVHISKPVEPVLEDTILDVAKQRYEINERIHEEQTEKTHWWLYLLGTVVVIKSIILLVG